MLLAIRHADSSAKFVCASQPVVHQSGTCQQSKNLQMLGLLLFVCMEHCCGKHSPNLSLSNISLHFVPWTMHHYDLSCVQLKLLQKTTTFHFQQNRLWKYIFNS
jgi:hypothetical protein